MVQSRSWLGVSSEQQHKRGRASPLPQAVKGAQVQMVGPGSDPNIKSEFGRLFQGLGSGLGGPGHLTPSRQSPVPQRIRDSVDAESASMVRGGSKGSKAGNRRIRDEADDEDRPAQGVGGSRKRQNAHNNNNHNHSTNPFYASQSNHNNHALSNVQSTTDPITTTTTTTTTTTPVLTFPKPSITVTSHAVYEACASKPARFIGSALYDVTIKPSPFASTTTTSDKWGGYYIDRKSVV